MAVGVDVKMKNFFFDRLLVQRELGKDNAKALSKIGAFVRRRARSSMQFLHRHRRLCLHWLLYIFRHERLGLWDALRPSPGE